MRIRLYIDEDAMAGILVKGLRARGIDVATVLEEQMIGRKDEEQLEYALEQKRTLYTYLTWEISVVFIRNICLRARITQALLLFTEGAMV